MGLKRGGKLREMTWVDDFEEAQLMLKQFVHYPVIVELPDNFGPIVGVLTGIHIGMYGRWILHVHAFQGIWVLIRDWICLKTARSST